MFVIQYGTPLVNNGTLQHQLLTSQKTIEHKIQLFFKLFFCFTNNSWFNNVISFVIKSTKIRYNQK